LNRKLLVLNIALGIGVIYAGVELRSAWVAAKARQKTMPGPAPNASFVAPVAPLAVKPAVLPSGYVEVAQKFLFDASRNPDIPKDPPPPPPPPRDPPPLPSYHGMMDFGDPKGPIALITEKDTPGHEERHAGDKIGEFTLLAFDRKEMSLEWEGRVLHKRLNEGGSEQAKPRAAAAPAAGTPEPPPPGVIFGQAPQQPVYEQPQQRNETGPGVQMTDSVRACQAGDTSSAGTVNGGYVKQVNNSPMGPQCIWRAIGK
jgi:hypothetical protein